MSMTKRRKYSEEFKRGAVEQASRPGVSSAQVAPELGIRDNLLTCWKREAQRQGKVAFGGPGRRVMRNWHASSVNWPVYRRSWIFLREAATFFANGS